MGAINRCRIYLQVVFISDISDMIGTMIIEEAFLVMKIRDSTLNWSRQVRPPLGDRKIWIKYLKRLCINDNELITSLGKWVRPSHQI